MPVTAAIGITAAVTGIVSAINNTSDKNKKRLYEQNLASLSMEAKSKLNKQLLEADSEAARQKLLADTLSNSTAARIANLNATTIEQEKNKKAILIVGGVVAGIIIIGMTYYAFKKNGGK